MHASALSFLFVNLKSHTLATHTPLQPADRQLKHQVSDAAAPWHGRPEASAGFMVYVFEA